MKIPARQLRILKEVVNLPTAPFNEAHVIDYIRQFVARRPQLHLQPDRFGNLLITYAPPGRSARPKRPLVFAAHMDHPGFINPKMIAPGRLEAEFRGWVSTSYFANQRIAFYFGGRWVPATIEQVLVDQPQSRVDRRAKVSADSFRDQQPPRGVIARVRGQVAPGSPGMWALPDARVRGNLIHARACDDVAGLAAVLCMLDVVCRGAGRGGKSARAAIPQFHAFFTRAEEVGFAGALAAVADKTLPQKAVVIAVECSKAIAGVAFGAGPVLRVGDKASVFTPAATAYCQVVAERLAKQDKGFCFQRRLMDGGTCESTAYCHYGYDATGICLPLGNYHNMDPKTGRIGSEYVDIRDFANLVKWFVELAGSPRTLAYDGRHPGLHKRLADLLKKHRPRLLKTAGRSQPIKATR